MGEADGRPDPLVAERDAATDAIVKSPHKRRVIVAGPGTGKTTTFKKALVQRGGRGLALTFLRVLADDLAGALADEADAITFHGYAKHRMKGHTPSGLTPQFEIYPPLLTLETWDLGVLGVLKVKDDIGPRAFNKLKTFAENRLQTLDFASGFPSRILTLGSYYDAAGFPDLVLRMHLDYKDHPEHVPPYPLVVVDEYQDFSPLETAIIDQLGTKSDVLIAGDDDQALYAFREATPVAIRKLATDPAAQRWPLPFCSRCTSVVVDAVLMTIERATAIGRLDGRLDKPFRDFPPTKASANGAHPKIFDVRCTHTSYVKRYVAARIAEISQDDIREAAAGNYPAALVIGPAPFLPDVAEHLSGTHPKASFKPSNSLPVVALDGYLSIARDPRSNLGWRILVHATRPPNWKAQVRAALEGNVPLVDQLDQSFRDEHLAIAERLNGAWKEEIGDSEREDLANRLGIPTERLEEMLGVGLGALSVPSGESEGAQEESLTLGQEVTGEIPPEEEPLLPSIMFTSLLGAKGLSAAHVFVVGMCNGHFPRDTTPTDDEICQFIVALSRTRKACHLVSTTHLGGATLAASTFLAWVSGQTTPPVWINKDSVPG